MFHSTFAFPWIHWLTWVNLQAVSPFYGNLDNRATSDLCVNAKREEKSAVALLYILIYLFVLVWHLQWFNPGKQFYFSPLWNLSIYLLLTCVIFLFLFVYDSVLKEGGICTRSIIDSINHIHVLHSEQSSKCWDEKLLPQLSWDGKQKPADWNLPALKILRPGWINLRFKGLPRFY